MDEINNEVYDLLPNDYYDNDYSGLHYSYEDLANFSSPDPNDDADGINFGEN